MSEIENIETTNTQAHFGFDFSKIFIRDNQFDDAETLVNKSGGAKDFKQGLVLGMITLDVSGDKGKLVPSLSTATDGSEFAYGVLKSDVVQLADDGEIKVSVAVAGHVAEDKLIFDNGTDTIDTFVPVNLGKKIKGHLYSNTMGIKVIEVEELSKLDNQ